MSWVSARGAKKIGADREGVRAACGGKVASSSGPATAINPAVQRLQGPKVFSQ